LFLKPLVIISALLCWSFTSTVWAQDKINIHLKWYHKFQFAGYYAAQQQGYFQEENLKVTLIEGGPLTNHLHQLINGSSQYVTLGSESISSLAIGSPVVILASIFQHAPEVLITLKSSGITDIGQLEGKVLMLADKSIAGQVEAMLLRNSLTPHNYTRYTYDGNVKNLANGTVQAMYGYLSNEPYQLKQLGHEVNVFSPKDFDIDFYGDSLATTKDELENHPQRVAGVRRAVIRGWRYALDNPEEVISYILSLKTNNPLPFDRQHQRFEAQKTAQLIDANNIPIGYSSPTRWTVMFDTFNRVTQGRAVFQPSSIYDEFHQDRNWLKYVSIIGVITGLLVLLLYAWNRTLRIRLDSAIKDFEGVALKDPLTDMFNRSSMIVYFERCRHNRKKNVYLAIIDISGLQKLNKTQGFNKADHLIQSVAKSIKVNNHKGSRYYSLYGGKFAIIYQEKTRQDFENKVNSLCTKISHENSVIKLHSGGIEFDLNVDNSSLTTRAELALQHAKSSHAKQLVFFDDSLSEDVEQRERLLTSIEQAINNNEFVPFYQPKVNFSTGKIEGVEALIRWDKPNQGIVGPGEFLPVAESHNDIMQALESHIYERILLDCQSIIECFNAHQGFKVSINLSSKQFNRDSLVKFLFKKCDAFNVKTQFIEFEITESSMLESLDEAINISKELQEIGFSVALDDFGTGYSSLSYIQNLPVNVIKLDYSFVKKLPGDTRSAYVVEHIVSLAHKLGLEVVAEGVEEKAQLEYLGSLNVDLMQGFYYYKPMPIEELLKLKN
jgi:diguanylate cyclase (GGDEF)-like protein